jgi:hypothetical protein
VFLRDWQKNEMVVSLATLLLAKFEYLKAVSKL